MPIGSTTRLALAALLLPCAMASMHCGGGTTPDAAADASPDARADASPTVDRVAPLDAIGDTVTTDDRIIPVDAPLATDVTDAARPGDGGAAVTCWPFDPPSLATLRASSHKVFAHYFSPFPISIDNQPAATDYYTRNYLDPAGESGAHAYCGGFLRERPYPQTPWPTGMDWEELNMETEVRRAVAMGLDGFTYDVLDVAPTSVHRQRLDQLLTAAPRVDPGFRIQLVLDMTALGDTDAAALSSLQTLFASVGSNPALQRTSDGRIVVSAFGAEHRSAAFWNNALATLATMGQHLALIPMTVGGWAGNVAHFAGVALYGASDWGGRTVAAAPGLRTAGDAPHAAGLIWMGPVAPQDSRPKDLTFVEADNSQAFRAQWEATIAGSADWVQLVTWNDYSEDSEIALSSQIHSAFYDLSAYYIAWFKTGAQPPIVRDALYYFHRTQDMNAAPDLTRQRSAYSAVNGPTTSSNFIEVVGLLTAPGTLEIDVAGHVSRQDVAAGIQAYRIPLVEGTPTFRLVRGGATVVTLTSTSPISNHITYQDPLYHAGASTTCAH